MSSGFSFVLAYLVFTMNPHPSTLDLSKRAAVSMDPRTSLRMYYRSAESLIKQARIYDNENAYARAYVLYLRYLTLATEKLPKHPEYNAKSPDALALRKSCIEAFTAAERLKPILNRAHEKAAELINAQRTAQVQTQNLPVRSPLETSGTPRYYSQSGIEPKLETYMPAAQTSHAVNDATWSIQKELSSLRLDSQDRQPSQQTAASSSTAHSHQIYPSLTSRNQSDGLVYAPQSRHGQQPPILPEKPTSSTPRSVAPTVHSLEHRNPQPVAIAHHDVRPKPFTPSLPPKPDGLGPRTGSVADVQNTMWETEAEAVAWLESGAPLRQINLPFGIQQSFLNIAAKNTKANLETCGILSGMLRNNVFTVTYLIIPRQTATSDTVTTTHEELLFDFQDKKDLMTLGWIHTHPSQTCFMSSVDLHTHCSYQLMLPEAIAIVCAPKQEPSVGIFRLTDPPGLETIMNCTAKPAFHPHPDVPIYRDADVGGGHVRMVDHGFEVIDLR